MCYAEGGAESSTPAASRKIHQAIVFAGFKLSARGARYSAAAAKPGFPPLRPYSTKWLSMKKGCPALRQNSPLSNPFPGA
jgi:hypothetical protein